MKKLNILIQIFALSTFILSISIAQSEINFEKYSVKDGLSSSVVNSICQDSYGFLWIGTENGLNRFDGYNFKVYKHNPSDSTSIPGDNISSIIEDHDGNIWIAGFDAVAKFDRSTNKFISYSIEKYYSEPTNVTSIMEDSQNRIWIATNIFGIQLIDEHNKRFLIVGKTDNKINREWGNVCSITETNKGEIFAADYGQSSSLDSIRTQQGLYTFNEKNKTFELKNRLPKNISTSISNFVEDDFGNLWFSSNNKSQIFNFNPATNQIKSVALSIPSQSVITITTIFKDNDGYLWIGTTSGLIKYNPVSNKSVYYLNDNTNPNSISSNQVASIYQDSFGQLWIGTLDGGLNKVDLGKQPIHSYKLPHDKMRPIAIDAVSCITTSPDNDDVIWIGTMGNGLYSFNRKNGSFMFFRYDKNNKQSISGNNIFALTWDNSGNLWAATDSSLTKINVKTNEATRYLENLSGLDDGYLSANEIISDKTGKLWLATLHGVDIFI